MKQSNVATYVLIEFFPGSQEPMKKVCHENERRTETTRDSHWMEQRGVDTNEIYSTELIVIRDINLIRGPYKVPNAIIMKRVTS